MAVNSGVGFAIWRPDVWSSDKDAVVKAVANKNLWSEGSSSVMQRGQPVFQTFHGSTADNEGQQRMQFVLGNEPPEAPGTPRQGRLNDVSAVFDALCKELTDLYRVRESAVLAGRKPRSGHQPRAQLHHSDNKVPDRHNVLLIGAGYDAVGLWIWEHSAGILIEYEESGGSPEAYQKACEAVGKLCPKPVFVLLQPGEMIVMHGNVIHAGAKLDANSACGSVRVHKYMQSLHAMATVENRRDYTELLSPVMEKLFGRLFDRSEG
jgi:hypothetical protein